MKRNQSNTHCWPLVDLRPSLTWQLWNNVRSIDQRDWWRGGWWPLGSCLVAYHSENKFMSAGSAPLHWTFGLQWNDRPPSTNHSQVIIIHSIQPCRYTTKYGSHRISWSLGIVRLLLYSSLCVELHYVCVMCSVIPIFSDTLGQSHTLLCPP